MNLYNNLSLRQKEALRLKSLGLSYQEIAEHMNIAISTAKTHIINVYGKLGLSIGNRGNTQVQVAAINIYWQNNINELINTDFTQFQKGE